MGESNQSLGSPWYVKDRLPCRWSRIDLQPRDIRLLQTLLEQKFLSCEQIQNYFFGGKTRYAYLRIWKLRRFGLIDRLWVGFTRHNLYLATESAHDYFRDQFVEVPAPFSAPDLRSLSHDLLVTDIRFLFERMGFGASWTSERTWRMGRSVRLWAPDAIIRVGGDPFALEVECVQKMDRRYEEIFSRYQDDPEIAACLYVTSESLLGALMERAKHFPRIYFTTLPELFEKKEETVFRSSEGRFLSVEDNLESKLKQEGSPLR